MDCAVASPDRPDSLAVSPSLAASEGDRLRGEEGRHITEGSRREEDHRRATKNTAKATAKKTAAKKTTKRASA
ncbi:hypothetical protein WKI68_42330 [Streptomyces sp. MS1.HAVA.3]|uniref:Uncharacterized protein n=1 Tax=Streptomyces caledonius TaxID=3134107 RepID=A0ABU8UDV5_9ACTN